MNDPAGIDPTTQFGALQERVYGLGQQFLHFEQATTRSFQQVESAIATLSAELRAGGKTQWQTIVTSVGVLVGILGALGTLAYLPIKTGMDQLTLDQRALRESVVPRPELMERWRRTERDIRDLDASLDHQAERIVPRGEHEEKWRSNERRLGDIQHQLDEVKRLHVETYSAHDALTALGRRLERLEFPNASAQPRP